MRTQHARWVQEPVPRTRTYKRVPADDEVGSVLSVELRWSHDQLTCLLTVEYSRKLNVRTQQEETEEVERL